jgi:hypothetical protein
VLIFCGAHNNGLHGFALDLESATGDVETQVMLANATNNARNGLLLELRADDGDILSEVATSMFSGNGWNGIRAEIDGGGGGAAIILFEDLLTVGNSDENLIARAGINVIENYVGAVTIGGRNIVSTGNLGQGIRLVTSNNQAPTLDFGGGALGGMGQNSFYGNSRRDFFYNDNGSGATAFAQYNWWGVNPPLDNQFNTVWIDRSNPLATDP